MAAPRSVLIVSAAPGNTIVNIAREIANRRHFTIFACTNPARFVKPSPESTWLRIVDINPGSPASLSPSIDEVSSIIRSNGFDSLDVLVNDVGVGSPLALLDVMMDEASESYERKVSDALSLAGSCATLLHRDSGKIVNMSSAGAMVSAPCMNKCSQFSAKRAITDISEQMRLEASLRHLSIETVMIETLPSATKSISRVILPERFSYSPSNGAASWWGLSRGQASQPLEPLYELIMEIGGRRKSNWLWEERSHFDQEDDVSKLEKGYIKPVLCE